MSALFLRRAFAETSALAALDRGTLPDYDQWRRRLYLLEQRHVAGQPDHMLKDYRDSRLPVVGLGATHGFGTIALDVLQQLAERYLERCAGRVVVRAPMFQDWHQMITHLSPLAIQVAFRVKEGQAPQDSAALIEWLHDDIGETALLAPADPTLEHLIESEGLHELHMHLNGSTEVDIIWQDALRHPDRYAGHLRTGLSQEIVADLYEGLETGLDSYLIAGRLRAARRLRYMLAENLAAVERGGKDRMGLGAVLNAARADLSDGALERSDESAGVQAFRRPKTSTVLANAHPFLVLAPWVSAATPPIVLEAAFLFRLLAALQSGALGEASGLALFHSLAVQQQMIALTVQQLSQFGFDQFQKFTMTEMRSKLESESYAPRLRQLALYPDYRLIRHLEGRFAPKSTDPENKALIAKIIRGAMKFRGIDPPQDNFDILNKNAPDCLLGGRGRIGRPDFELSLVAHFIKGKDVSDPETGLFRGQRRKLQHQAQALEKSWKTSPAIRDLLQGVDAAANELHNPPEIFAATFRRMRRVGIPHATYHAGEDFRHLIGGMRAIYEAINFLDLGKGDRIGHATAAGISPWLWLERAGDRIMTTKRHLLDDLVFAWSLLRHMPEYVAITEELAFRIANASVDLYDREISAPLLLAAWRMRRLDLLEILLPGRFDGPDWGSFDLWRRRAEREARHLTQARSGTMAGAELLLIQEALLNQPAAFALHLETMKRWESGRGSETREVDANYMPADALLALQNAVLTEIVKRGMAIEALPTSNLRISYYRDFHEHHLFRWLGLALDTPLSVRPDIVVGTDDTGIFATNLKIEFALIADTLRQHFNLAECEVEARLSRLNRTAASFRFRPRRS